MNCPGSSRSTTTFHDWTYPRCSSDVGIKRICAVAGSGTRPELMSGSTISGMPCSMVRTGWNEFGELKLLA
jgi:hypothetical protein